MTSSSSGWTDQQIGDMIRDRMSPGHSRLVTDLAAFFRVPQYRIRDAAEVHESLELIVGRGRPGAVWSLPQKDWMVERTE